MILEIRRYEIVPGRRDEFVEWFDEAVLPEMEARGMRIIGQFVSIDDPNVFYYLRSFDDEQQRDAQLADLYESAVWKDQLVDRAEEMEMAYRVETVVPTPGSRLR